MNGFEDSYDLEVLERQSQGVYIVRLHDASQIASISSDDDVRWMGLMHLTCVQQTMQ